MLMENAEHRIAPEAYKWVLGFKLSSHSCKTGSFHGSQKNMLGVCVSVPCPQTFTTGIVHSALKRKLFI